MQPLGWYYRRLRTMSPAEIAWRAQSSIGNLADRARFPLGLYPYAREEAPFTAKEAAACGFHLSELPPGAWRAPGATAQEAAWYERLRGRAEQLAQHRFTFFDLRDHFLGDPIDWNRDHSCGRQSPLRHAASINYRDFHEVGDCKLVWEPNRHQQLVVLGRAWRAGGDRAFAEAALRQLLSWLDHNPFGKGMNWRSPLELAIRMINWVWALDLIRDSGCVTDEIRQRILKIVYLHLWEITRKYSRGSSANNHLIGEAAGVFIASSYFSGLPNAARWRDESRAILLREIDAQTYADGCTRELAMSYHLFVLQFLLFSGLVARRTGDDFSPDYWRRLELMMDFVGRVGEGGEQLPMFGDADDGYVLDLGDPLDDHRGLLAAGASLFGRADFKTWAGGWRETAEWLLGRPGRDRFEATAGLSAAAMPSHAFPQSGHYLLQYGGRDGNGVSVLFDCGELGYQSIAAHGHADALSISCRAFGLDLFVDPGTYDYFTFPEWRNYFRATRAHNTVEVDGEDQSVMLGPFLWGRRAGARCLQWRPGPDGGAVTGEHDGYGRLADPAVHRRTLELDGRTGTLSIRDEISAAGPHRIALYFHLSEHCALQTIEANRALIDVGGRGRAEMEIDERLTVTTLKGSEPPIGGWVSRGYHRKTPTTTIVASGTLQGGAPLRCQVRFVQNR